MADVVADLVFLRGEKVKTLADLIYKQEVNNINAMDFSSENDRALYLRDCRLNYETITSLLKQGSELKTKYQNDAVLSPIVAKLFTHIENCVNYSLQIVRNYTARKDLLEKTKEHIESFFTSIQGSNARSDAVDVEGLGKEIVDYDNGILDYTQKIRSPASKEYSKILKAKNTTFPDLVATHQAKLKYTGRFVDLKETQKIRVYNSVMDTAGLGTAMTNEFIDSVKSVGGIAMMLITAGQIVWDVFSSEHVMLEATKNVIVEAAKLGGAALGEIVGAALTTQLYTWGYEMSYLMITMVGILSSVAGAFLIGLAAGSLVALIFGSGEPPPKSTEGLVFFTAEMPDGVALARQLSHH